MRDESGRHVGAPLEGAGRCESCQRTFDPYNCPECGTEGEERDFLGFFPRSLEDEVPELPPELRVIYQAHQTLARDATGAADLWLSGRAFLDEHGVCDPEERRRWFAFWVVISGAVADARARRQEDAEAERKKKK